MERIIWYRDYGGEGEQQEPKVVRCQSGLREHSRRLE